MIRSLVWQVGAKELGKLPEVEVEVETDVEPSDADTAVMSKTPLKQGACMRSKGDTSACETMYLGIDSPINVHLYDLFCLPKLVTELLVCKFRAGIHTTNCGAGAELVSTHDNALIM